MQRKKRDLYLFKSLFFRIVSPRIKGCFVNKACDGDATLILIFRISNGLPRIEVYGPLEWNFPVPIGYNSKLKHSLSYGISGLGYLARPDNSVFR